MNKLFVCYVMNLFSMKFKIFNYNKKAKMINKDDNAPVELKDNL